MADNQQPLNFKYIFVIGPPGSGKCTVCDGAVALFAEPRFIHLSAGEAVRSHVKLHPTNVMGLLYQPEKPEAERERDLLASKDLATILKTRMINEPGYYRYLNNPIWLISGFPRTLEQMLNFEEIAGPPLKVISVECDAVTGFCRNHVHNDAQSEIDRRIEWLFNGLGL
ncbi:hypothetical protein F5Y08DRAFT_339569 [Xylaria arbuscula]|nr:hypothetical protein F5Y08DRAFT_339569 [Xylaria arbuscula]